MRTKIDSREQNGWVGTYERTCAGGGNVTVRETSGGFDPWDSFPWPLHRFPNNKLNYSAYNGKRLLDTVNAAAHKSTQRIDTLTGGYELLRNRNNRLTPFADDRWSPVGTAPTCHDITTWHGTAEFASSWTYTCRRKHFTLRHKLTLAKSARSQPNTAPESTHKNLNIPVTQGTSWSQRGVMPKYILMNQLLLQSPENRGSCNMKTYKNGKKSTSRFCDHQSMRAHTIYQHKTWLI